MFYEIRKSYFSHVYFTLLFVHLFFILLNVLPDSVFKAENVAEIYNRKTY